jgi:hypothetical protein
MPRLRTADPGHVVVRAVIAQALLCILTSAASAMDASACRDESESGSLFVFEDLTPGTVLIRLRGNLSGDYPNFAVETAPGGPGSMRCLVDRPFRRIVPQLLTESGAWKKLPVEGPPDMPAFVIPLGKRTVIRLWDPDASVDSGPLETSGLPMEIAGPRVLGVDPTCANACYSPGNLMCYDFNRLECYLDGISGHPFVDVRILGYTGSCPDATNHVPKPIYKVRITDASVPVEEKTRIVLTARVHGGERLTSFLIEGLMDYALGREVHPIGAGFLPELPETPSDLLQDLDLVIYPNLNPDGAQDLDNDGESDYNRYKCNVDMNRRWGTATEKTEAWEIHLIHEDILEEAALKPFAFHRDFHSWSELVQGGFRHGIGTWEDENDEPAITVGEDYHERETFLFEVEENRVPYRARENYVVNDMEVPPIPGSARFALYEELAGTGLITNTSETSYVVENRTVLSVPAYRGGNDVRHEGAWLLLAYYEGLAGGSLPHPTQFIRGDVNDDGSVDLADAVKIIMYLFRGVVIRCQVAADLDENAFVNISDAAYVLNFQFRHGPPPPAPYPQPGPADADPILGCGED